VGPGVRVGWADEAGIGATDLLGHEFSLFGILSQLQKCESGFVELIQSHDLTSSHLQSFQVARIQALEGSGEDRATSDDSTSGGGFESGFASVQSRGAAHGVVVLPESVGVNDQSSGARVIGRSSHGVSSNFLQASMAREKPS